MLEINVLEAGSESAPLAVQRQPVLGDWINTKEIVDGVIKSEIISQYFEPEITSQHLEDEITSQYLESEPLN